MKKTKKPKIARNARKPKTKTKKVAAKRTRVRAQARGDARPPEAPLSPEADQWLAAALAEHNTKQDALKQEWGFGAFERWAFDTTTKTFTLHFADGSQLQADGQVLGTYCPGDSSWEWAWNNPNLEPQVAVDSHKVKEVGEQLGISYMTAGKVPVPNREFATYLCAVGVKATGATGIYLGGEGPVEVAIVLNNLRRQQLQAAA